MVKSHIPVLVMAYMYVLVLENRMSAGSGLKSMKAYNLIGGCPVFTEIRVILNISCGYSFTVSCFTFVQCLSLSHNFPTNSASLSVSAF